MLQLEAARFELSAVMVTQEGQQQDRVPAPVAYLGRAPVHVKIAGVDARRPVLEDVPPPPVVPRGHGHVIGDHVEYLPEARLSQRLLELEVALLASQLFVHSRRVDHVVAVGTALGRLQHRRQVDVAYPELGQITGYRRRVGEIEPRM